jgi:hypothetical protein
LLLPFSGVTFALAVPWLLFGMPAAMQKEALLLVLHLLVKQVERKDFSWSTQTFPIGVCS